MSAASTAVEAHHVDPVPAAERHGGPGQQFWLWAGFNTNVFNLVLGGALVALGLTFWQAVLAILTGTAIGAGLIALHAMQGPRLGVPQMLQSRAQFGFYGTSFLLVAVLVLNLGFIAAQLAIEGIALNIVAPAVPVQAWIVILTPPALLIGVIGYVWIHRAAQATAAVAGITIVVMLVQGLAYGPLPAAQAGLAAPHWGLFLAGVALLVIDLLSFGPFVSDYSRYLPASVRPGRLAAGIWAGNVLATAGSCIAGAYLAALLPKLSTIAAIGQVSGRAVLVIMAGSLIIGCTVNAYTGSFQVLALAHVLPRWRHARPSAWLRVTVMAAVLAAGMVLAVAGYSSFVTNLSNFLDLLLVIFIPWSAVNLTDYFLVARGRYDVAALYTPGGVYGRVRWRGLAAYALGLIAEIPFISQDYYTGALVHHLGGADISWLTGFAVAGVAYLAVSTLPLAAAAAGVPGRPGRAIMIVPGAGYQPGGHSRGGSRSTSPDGTQPATAGGPAGQEQGFSGDLAGSHPQLWAALRGHRWITRLATGTLPAQAKVCWAQQRRHLAGHQEQALAALRAAGPPEGLERWIGYLEEDTAAQRRMLAAVLEGLAAPPNVAEGLTSLGYGCYLRCCARDGLAAGLTALYTVHCAAQHAWDAVPRPATAGTALAGWQLAWTGPGYHTTLNALAEGLEEVAAPGSRYQRERLVRVCGEVLRWEQAFWDMCSTSGEQP